MYRSFSLLTNILAPTRQSLLWVRNVSNKCSSAPPGLSLIGRPLNSAYLKRYTPLGIGLTFRSREVSVT